jgi:signal transduction histidine kinase
MRFKLNLLLLLLVTGILLLSSAFSYYTLREDLFSRFDGRKQELARRLQVNLANPLWNFDENQITAVVEAEMDSLDVAAIQIYQRTPGSDGAAGTDGKVLVSRTSKRSASPDESLWRASADETLRVPLYARSSGAADGSAARQDDQAGVALIRLSRQHVETVLAEQVRNRIVEIVVLNVLLVLALSVLMSRIVIEPLAKLARAFKALARDARARELDIKGGDEFGEVVDAFNLIVGRLLTDINRRIAAEKKLLASNEELIAMQSQLLQSEKMAAIGQLAAGVAHEINNPIGFVNSNLGTLKTYSGHLLAIIDAYERGVAASTEQARQAADLDFLREDLPALLVESQDGLNRVTKIVQDLKDYSRVNDVGRQQADLNAAMESTLNVVWNELKYKAEVIRELGDIPKVDCIPAQINQVFTNLLVNAAQAIPEHGKIVIRSRCEGEQVCFEIEDNGLGMSEDVQRRIFEPFFTTKPVGKGTGLGLSISYDIVVKKHGGRLEVSSEPGKGSCFRVSLPLEFKGPSADSDSK